MNQPISGFNPSPIYQLSEWKKGEFVFWLLPIAAYFLFPDNLALLSQIAITSIFALSLDLILGFSGIISLGHAAFFGIGAYTAGLMAKYGIHNPLLGLVGSALVASLLGFITSFLVLRGADLTRLMVTLGVASMLYEAANKLTEFTGGVDGLQGIELSPLLGQFEFDIFGKTAYIYTACVLFIIFWYARHVVNSPFGHSLKGIKQNVSRMPALGTSVNERLIIIYTISAGIAGIAGGLLTQTTQFVSVDVFSFSRSAELLLMLILGGAGTLYGAIIGTILFMVVHHMLSSINPQYWQFWLGLLLILVVLFARNGIMGILKSLQLRLQGVQS